MTQREQRILNAIEKSNNKAAKKDPITFARQCIAYAKAVKEGRLCCVVYHVSKSGMTRHMTLAACERVKLGNGEVGYRYRRFNYFLNDLLGYPIKGDYLAVAGCGMDMVFRVNYSAILAIRELKAITPRATEELAQRRLQVL